MTIRIWQSYSCNNSSSFRMIARFADATTANEVASELAAFLEEHAREIDARPRYTDEPTAVSRALGDKYGFAWNDLLYWGTGGLAGDEPQIFVEDSVMIVLHTYCGGGFGEGLPAFLANRGATVEPESESDVSVSILFRSVRGADPELEAELQATFDQLDLDEVSGWVEPFKAPWKIDDEAYGQFTGFRDAGAVGLYFPASPHDLQNVKDWLAKRGIERPVMRIGENLDEVVFSSLAKARCSSCDGPVEYLHPALHDIETAQVVCRPCGGLYELSAFLPQEAK